MWELPNVCQLHRCIVRRSSGFHSIHHWNLLDVIRNVLDRAGQGDHHGQNAMQLRLVTTMLPRKRLHSNVELGEKHGRE